MSTYFQTKEEAEQSREWHIVDAAGVPVGRIATEVASLIRGKHKPTFTPHVDGGDYVVVINAEKVVFTGRKLESKLYRKHSGYIGGLKEESAQRVLEKTPERVLERAIRGMLPKGTLGRSMNKKLKVYAGTEHPHVAQNPKEYQLKYAS